MKKQYITGLLISIIISIILLITIWVGYQEMFFWNFHTGESKIVKSLFTIPVYKEQSHYDFLFYFFSESERAQMKDHWLPVGSSYYNSRFQYRVSPGIAMGIAKQMELLTTYSEVFTKQEKMTFKERIIHSVNTSCINTFDAEWEIVTLTTQMNNILQERKNK